MLRVSASFPAVPQRLTYAELAELLCACDKRWTRLPVVQLGSGHIVGAVPWNSLRNLVRDREREYDTRLQHELLPQLGSRFLLFRVC
jgi:hypothetical protein